MNHQDHEDRTTGEAQPRSRVPDPDTIKREFWEEMESSGRKRNPRMDLNEIYERAGEMDYLKMHEATERAFEGRANGRIAWRWFWKSPLFMLITGSTGMLLLLGCIWSRELLTITGVSMLDSNGNDWSGMLKLVLFVIGLVLLAAAAPAYRPVEWTQEAEDRLELVRQRYHQKKFGGK